MSVTCLVHDLAARCKTFHSELKKQLLALTIDMNYNWTNNAYWLLRLRLKPGAWADQQYSVGHDFQKTPNCSSAMCSASAIIMLASGSSSST